MRWIWKTGDWSCSAMACLEKAKPAYRDGAGCIAHYVAGRARGREGWPSALQQRHQAAALVERVEVVASAHPRLADEDLRHRAAARLGDHRRPLAGVEVDADLLDGVDPALLEQLLR